MAETYFDSAEDVEITFSRALLEMSNHGLSATEQLELLAELGVRETYTAQEVLSALGY